MLSNVLRFTWRITLICMFLYSPSVFSSESLDSIKIRAKDFLEKNIHLDQDESIEIKIHASNEMPREMICSREIEINLPREVNKEQINSLELTCNGDNSWHTFLPVQVDKFINVVVTNRVILMNEPLSESDLDYAKSNVNRLYSGFYKDKKEVLGHIAMHTINAGSVITKKNISFPKLVHRNQVIDLVARKNSVQVVMQGIAKSDGCLNETITAYNPSSKRTVEAVVVDYNKAEVVS